ncbi:MAG: hypothetical protein M1505_01560 [Patescibacteria group bacterium]|nr:hypothetical protein [Patescibacteria group bacterium]MCL5257900.1 hypothetical protein [Patescibacteria group bacterium]
MVKIKNRGQVLFGIVLIFLLIALFFVISLNSLLVNEVSNGQALIQSVQAKAAAFSGLELALEQIAAQPGTTTATTTINFNGSSVNYLISTTSANTSIVLVQSTTVRTSTTINIVGESFKTTVLTSGNKISQVKISSN